MTARPSCAAGSGRPDRPAGSATTVPAARSRGPTRTAASPSAISPTAWTPTSSDRASAACHSAASPASSPLPPDPRRRLRPSQALEPKRTGSDEAVAPLLMEVVILAGAGHEIGRGAVLDDAAIGEHEH